ncbi:unnamed protein product [Lactuca virosa]|uniref:Ubiquitin-like protease family profile domain-containing protein n=1 Tax=Lactuca virosa TaxID=75947 RepID=A0AAU9P9Z0_9ASTR|nr:unnamed protein product [Lactuca virosa]
MSLFLFISRFQRPPLLHPSANPTSSTERQCPATSTAYVRRLLWPPQVAAPSIRAVSPTTSESSTIDFFLSCSIDLGCFLMPPDFLRRDSFRIDYLMHPSPETSKKRAIEELSDSQDDHHPTTITRQRRGNRGNMVNQAKKLNSDKVHSYLENLWLSIPEDKKSSFTHLDPLWYTLYSSDSNKEKVLNWIKKKDIFSRKYVVFPIVQWGHWSVLIFCHFGESLGSKFKTPCILLLDSLAKADHSKQLEPVIRKNLERTEDKKLLRKMPFLVPKVPQQRDNQECGFFALYYIKLFVESAPESFSISNGYPYFMKKDWFSSEGLDGFCKTLDSSHK